MKIELDDCVSVKFLSVPPLPPFFLLACAPLLCPRSANECLDLHIDVNLSLRQLPELMKMISLPNPLINANHSGKHQGVTFCQQLSGQLTAQRDCHACEKNSQEARPPRLMLDPAYIFFLISLKIVLAGVLL